MKQIAYGYERRKVSEEGLIELEEVSLRANPTELRAIASFLSHCADLMETIDGFGHEHLRDYAGFETWDIRSTDIIVANHPDQQTEHVMGNGG